MKVCIYSKSDLDTLEKWAIQYFSEVPKRPIQRRVFNEQVFDEKDLGNMWKIVPIKDNDYLDFYWIVPGSSVQYYKMDPAKIITHLFGHEGENSLISFLREEGLATELDASRDDEMNLFRVINVRIKLTPKGFENYKEVIGYVFQYLRIIKEQGHEKWIFEEIKQQNEINFKYLEKSEPVDVVTNLSPKMLYYPFEDVLKLKYFFEEYDEKFIKEEINKLDIKNLRIYMISKKCEPDCYLIEDIYSIKYSVQQFDQDIFELYNGNIQLNPKITKKKLGLPPKNIFIPKRFDLYYEKNENIPDEPIRLEDHKLSVIWMKKDNKYNLPKGAAYCRIYSKEYNNPECPNSVVLHLENL
jgi:Secreted/periplasmic Zn-dependent peptidases, insulinase-like